ncbi:MAG: 2,3-bisphosphoglycerate-independent phosphoglycerate mutase [Alphaproteobacteria bacterium]|nr:2,3-bisphosphoglycerate-independent phosphoglycerate mutase [Alphaproteobacteria bacterium]
MSRPRPVVLCILDGWGHRDERDQNAVALARTPVFDRLWTTCPHGLLKTSALEVGLPEGQMGNSEVGHTNLGAGRVVMQDLPRIDQAIADGSLATNPSLRAFAERLRARGGRCHVMGLVSPGGVHSHQDHIAGLARILASAGVPVVIHAFLDGRDTPPSSAGEFVARLVRDTAGMATIATVSGRYYAMDRDRRWERVAKAYDAIVSGAGPMAASADQAIAAAYASGTTDEFVLPTVVAGYDGLRPNDGLVMANFRADRARQLLSALLDPAFNGFARTKVVAGTTALGLTSYSAAHDKLLEVLFPPVALGSTLGEIVAKSGLTQLRIAETEKYAHVTFFFNGGEERVFEGEQRILIPSPKVATYDLQPEMAAAEVTDKLVAAIDARQFDLIVCNFANTDMVGHTGKLDAAIKAVEAVDACLGRIERAVVANGGVLLITADHGNAERMIDENGEPHTQHTLDDVPFIIVNGAPGTAVDHGRLADVAPTILAIMGLPQPAVMTGRNLIRGANVRRRESIAARAGS